MQALDEIKRFLDEFCDKNYRSDDVSELYCLTRQLVRIIERHIARTSLSRDCLNGGSIPSPVEPSFSSDGADDAHDAHDGQSAEPADSDVHDQLEENTCEVSGV